MLIMTRYHGDNEANVCSARKRRMKMKRTRFVVDLWIRTGRINAASWKQIYFCFLYLNKLPGMCAAAASDHHERVEEQLFFGAGAIWFTDSKLNETALRQEIMKLWVVSIALGLARYEDFNFLGIVIFHCCLVFICLQDNAFFLSHIKMNLVAFGYFYLESWWMVNW